MVASLAKAIRKTFDSLVILVAWSIWKEFSQQIFQKVTLTAAELVDSAHFSMLFPLAA